MTLPRVLDSNGNEVKRLHPEKLSITERIIPLSTAQMRLPAYEELQSRSWVELFTVNGSVGIFRSQTPEKGYGNISNVVNLEHGICELGDWLVTADIDQTQSTVADALRRAFSYYRGSKWQLGQISVSGNVVYSWKYPDILTCVNGIVAQIPSAMLTYDFSTTPWTVNVVPRGQTVSAEGRLSRNVKSAFVTRNDTKLCTRVYVDGMSGYLDADTISTYGIIEKHISGEYTATQAATVANQYLAQHKIPQYSIEIEMLDLSHITGEEIDKIELGKLYRLAIPDENVTVTENVFTIIWNDCVNFENVAVVTLSTEEQTLVTFIQDTSNEVAETQETLNSTVKQFRTYVEQTDTAIDLVAERVDDTESILQQAGLHLDAQGVLIYAVNQNPGDDYIGSRFTSLSARIDVESDRISLVVTGEGPSAVINTASIVAGINAQGGSYVKIDADKIALHGNVSIGDLNEYDEAEGILEIGTTEGDTFQLRRDGHRLGGLYAEIDENNNYYSELLIDQMRVDGKAFFDEIQAYDLTVMDDVYVYGQIESDYHIYCGTYIESAGSMYCGDDMHIDGDFYWKTYTGAATTVTIDGTTYTFLGLS